MRFKEYSKKAKKIAAVCLASAMCLSTCVVASNNNVPAEAADVVLGDMDNSGKVTLDDVTMALKVALKLSPLTEQVLAAGDVNNSGAVDLDDVIIILKDALNIEKIKQPEPTETVVPTPTPTGGISIATRKPTPTSSAVPTKPVIPTSIPLPVVTPGTAVTGTSISVTGEGLNGAEYDSETGVYTFTDANKTARKGIQFTNPWAGNTSLRQTVDEALPLIMVNGANSAVGLIQDDKLLSLDGTKTVIGSIEEKDGIVEMTPVVSSGAAVSEAAVVTGKAVTWHHGLLPVVNGVDSKVDYMSDLAELYAKPKWTNGVSISFWCKYDWQLKKQSDAAPILVIRDSSGCDNAPAGEFAKTHHTGDFALMLRLNGGVSMEGDESGNCFRASNYIAGNDGEWNYFTVTFANDWITVYVNGQELVYNDLVIDKDDICYFNNGFLTRYSPVNEVKKSEVSDIRNYLKNGWVSKTGDILDVLDKECCVIGNSRYKNPKAVTVKPNSDLNYDLLVDLLTKKDTQIWFGAASGSKCTASDSVNAVDYKVQSGTQLAGINCYNSELTPAEVAANYEKEKSEAKFLQEND